MREKLIELLNECDSKCKNTPCDECEYCDNLDCNRMMELDHLIANGVTIQKWIPVSERLPESGVHVLVACEMNGRQYVCDGFFADRYTQQVTNTDYDIACEYCEEDDEYYLWQGWYEVIKNWDDYNSIVIGDTVTHWMPLPQPPKEG